MSARLIRRAAAVVLIAGGSAFAGEAARPNASKSAFEPPVRLKANGRVIDTGAAWGHSSPSVTDLNGDGKPDLVVGDFSGKLRRYLNVGSAGAPEYVDDGLIQAGGEDAHVKIYCCVGAQPRFHDLDGDGLRDMLVNSYDPGHAYLFRGRRGDEFAARDELVDKTGKPIRSSTAQEQDHQAFGSFYEAVDWDDDGDLDLLIGCFGGDLRLRINEGAVTRPAFAAENVPVKAGGAGLRVKGHLCPVVADWDGDGLWDVIAGSDDGSVTWFRNTGRKGAPAFAAGETLVERHDGTGFNVVLWDKDKAVPGIRSQPEVTDHNGDGKLDLLVGDFYTAYDLKPGLTEAQKQEVGEMLAALDPGGDPFVAKTKALRKDFAARYPGDQIFSDKAREEWFAAYKALYERYETGQRERQDGTLVRKLRPFLASTRGKGQEIHDLAQSNGHVWLFIRK
jgi:hypothetical protein